jgi:hypothetical protein
LILVDYLSPVNQVITSININDCFEKLLQGIYFDRMATTGSILEAMEAGMIPARIPRITHSSTVSIIFPQER